MEPPVDLTIPEPGSTTTRRILGAYLKRCLADYLRLPQQRFDSQIADDFGALRTRMEGLARGADAGLVFSILRRAPVSTFLRCIDAELWGRGDVKKLDAWLMELNGLVFLELKRAGALPEGAVRLRRPPPRPVPPIADIARPYHPIAGDLSLALVDSNPLADVEAHPDKSGNTVDLGGHPPGEWVNALRSALSTVDRYLPDLGAEIRLVMQHIVPVGYDAERHLSASYAEAIGMAYLSLHPDPMTMTEALIHEFSHNKLNALGRLDAVLENAHTPLFASPVRPDPRPLWGVLLAVHAFTPVARLYELMQEAGDPLSVSPAFSRRFRDIAQGNHEGMTTLTAHARPTPVGRGVVDELRRWDEHFQA